jgi:hypothetical protein
VATPESVLYVGANSASPIIVWTDKLSSQWIQNSDLDLEALQHSRLERNIEDLCGRGRHLEPAMLKGFKIKVTVLDPLTGQQTRQQILNTEADVATPG